MRDVSTVAESLCFAVSTLLFDEDRNVLPTEVVDFEDEPRSHDFSLCSHFDRKVEPF